MCTWITVREQLFRIISISYRRGIRLDERECFSFTAMCIFVTGSIRIEHPPERVPDRTHSRQEKNDHRNHNPTSHFKCVTDLQLGNLPDVLVKMP